MMTQQIDTSNNRVEYMTDRELELLFSNLLQSRRMYEIARGRLQPDDFPEHHLHYTLLWESVLHVIDQHNVTVPHAGLRSQIETEISRRIAGDPTAMSEEEIQLLTGGDWGMEGGSILDHIFDVEPSELIEEHGLELLRRFLHEQQIVAPLKELLNPEFGGSTVADFSSVIDDLTSRLQDIDSIADDAVSSVGDEWPSHLQRLEQFRGREIIGLRTGIEQLDHRMLGMRGTTVLGAMPGVGKTTLAAQIGVGVCQHHAINDAVVVIISLDMDRDAIVDRIHCHLANLEWATLKFGSPGYRNNGQPPWFNQGHQTSLEIAENLLDEWQVGSRTLIHDRSTLGDNITANRLVTLTRNFKGHVGASRAILILDYLQLLPLPDHLSGGGDLEADRYRIRVIQDFVAKSKSPDNPDGDAVLAISEARKPSSAKDGWGQALSELMGSARLGYAPDAVLLYRRMTKKDVQDHYPSVINNAQAETWLRMLEQDGTAPIVLTLAKGRDGMSRGEWPMEFRFRRSTFQELTPCEVDDSNHFITPPGDYPADAEDT